MEVDSEDRDDIRRRLARAYGVAPLSNNPSGRSAPIHGANGCAGKARSNKSVWKSVRGLSERDDLDQHSCQLKLVGGRAGTNLDQVFDGVAGLPVDFPR